MPSGGVKGIAGIVSMVSGKMDDLPYVIVDSDKSGEDVKKKLVSNLYNGSEKKIIEIKEFSDIDNCEVEDIIPFDLQKRSIDKLFNKVEDAYFEDDYQAEISLVYQVEQFAQNHSLELLKGWKVDVAKDVKKQISKRKKIDIDSSYIDKWKKLFSKLNK